jgi:hypothetical protein
MKNQTHSQIAEQLKLQLGTISSLVSVPQAAPITYATKIPVNQRVAARTFAQQLWSCADSDAVSIQVQINRPGAEFFLPVATFVVEAFSRDRDFTTMEFSESGRTYSLLSDVVHCYLDQLERSDPIR